MSGNRAVSDFQLCRAHASKAGCSGGCENLHICRFFFADGKCQFGAKCKFGHTLDGNPHNATVLLARRLDRCSLVEIRGIIRSNNIHKTLPPICTYYNNQIGCKKDDRCMAVHVCQYFLTDACTFGERCRRSHDIFDSQPKNLLEKNGIDFTAEPEKILDQVQNGYKKIRGRPSAEERGTPKGTGDDVAQAGARSKTAENKAISSTGVSKIDEICTYHLRAKGTRKCQFGEKCMKYHSPVPYLWQYEKDGGWENICDAENEAYLEETFCDPSHDSCSVQTTLGSAYNVNFSYMTMMIKNGVPDSTLYPVRRLSTMSTVKADPSYVLGTQWQWYWQDDAGKFQRYTGLEHELEVGFLDTPDDLVNFSVHPHKYTANFTNMIQQNTEIGTKRRIRRRPKFVTRQDVVSTLDRSVTASSVTAIPPSWNSAPFPANETWRLATLKDTDAEYTDVKALFQKTVGNKIINIQRIENSELWEDYARMKTKMERRLASGTSVNEKQLFHGTRQNLINPICQQGFDWRMSGTSTGTLYGMGSYFARDAKYSASYTDCRKMFVVRVLVGEYTRGQPDYRRPPPKTSPTTTSSQGPEVQLYDACVDRTADPSIFVVFNAHQAYPEYIIEYM